jgi:hypothetical protein
VFQIDCWMRKVSLLKKKILLFFQSVIDLTKYAVGATDKFQGTGVFDFFKMTREDQKKTERPGRCTANQEKDASKRGTEVFWLNCELSLIYS